MLKIKDIKGFEDYTIDTNGNVFSKRKNKYLKQAINKFGYCKVTLQKNKFKKLFSVHRLVANAFISNLLNLPQVNHINGNKQDNKVENLEWVTPKENMVKAVEIGLFENVRKIQKENAIKNNLSKYHTLANEVTKKKVVQCDKNNKTINAFNSISDASRETGIAITGISYVCNNKRKTAGGYIWQYHEKDLKN